MRQTHSLTHPRHKPAQALDRLKHTLKKYIKRERGKDLPDGADFWDFDCRIGADEASATDVHPAELSKRLDGFAEAGASTVYVEILAKPAKRRKRPKPADDGADDPTEES